jgi:hypothetical protein
MYFILDHGYCHKLKPEMSVFFCCIVVSPSDGNSDLLLIFQSIVGTAVEVASVLFQIATDTESEVSRKYGFLYTPEMNKTKKITLTLLMFIIQELK